MISLGEGSVERRSALIEHEGSTHCETIEFGEGSSCPKENASRPLWPCSKVPPKNAKKQGRADLGIGFPYRCLLPGNFPDPEFFAKDPRFSIISVPLPLHPLLTLSLPVLSLSVRAAAAKIVSPSRGVTGDETKRRRKWVFERNFPVARLCGYEHPILDCC